MPDNVLIDVTRLVSRRLDGKLPTGIDRVSLEYLRYFSGRSTALVRFAGLWLELSPADSECLYTALLQPAAAYVNNRLRRLVATAVCRHVGHSYAASRFLFNTGHSGLEHKEYLQHLQRYALQPIFFVHDLIPISHPEYCRAGEADRHGRRMQTILNSGRGVIVNSAATLTELADYAVARDLVLPPTVLAPLAVPQLPRPAAPLLDKPYFVMLGTIEPRKNHWLLLQLWRQIIATLGAAAPCLVIIGQRGWECEHVVNLLERCDALGGYVLEEPDCSDSRLSSWLQHAQALLFPSFAEGFGMPLTEALSLGLPVIASDLSVFREIAGDIPEYLDPLDGVGWKQMILAYADSAHPLRLAQLARLSGFAAPTWAAHFAQVEVLLEQINA